MLLCETNLCFHHKQKSFYMRLTTDKNSEKFFKVFYDRMREAQAEIKATVTVNTGDSLAAKQEDKDTATKSPEAEHKKKGKKPFYVKVG